MKRIKFVRIMSCHSYKVFSRERQKKKTLVFNYRQKRCHIWCLITCLTNDDFQFRIIWDTLRSYMVPKMGYLVVRPPLLPCVFCLQLYWFDQDYGSRKNWECSWTSHFIILNNEFLVKLLQWCWVIKYKRIMNWPTWKVSCTCFYLSSTITKSLKSYIKVF